MVCLVLARLSLVLGALGAATVGLAAWVGTLLERGTPAPGGVLDNPAGAVELVAAVVLLGCLLWLDVLTMAPAVEVLRAAPRGPAMRGPAPRGMAVPPGWRRTVLVACGVLALQAPLGSPAGAAAAQGSSSPAPRPLPYGPAQPHPLDGLVLPDRVPTGPVTGPRPVAAPGPAPSRSAPARVTVRPGDSLWSITADLLAPTDRDAAVAAGWRRLHRANREVVGPDPHLIHPGTRLRVPPSLPDRGGQ